MGNMVLSQEQAFLSDIGANPDDDTPRLVFADWLTERDGSGDSEQAEFIRVQCQSQHLPPCTCSFGRMLTSCRRCLALLRELRLRGEMQDRLRNEWRSWADERNGPSPWWWAWEFRRGFIERIILAAVDWCRYAERLLATQPIREVRLTSRLDDCIDLRPPPRWVDLWDLVLVGESEPFATVDPADWLAADCLPGGPPRVRARVALLWPGIVFHGPDFPETSS
jgi:uncharacterized protein (TIGR02996 family)